MNYDFEKINIKIQELISIIRKNGLNNLYDKYRGIDQFAYDLEYVTLWVNTCNDIIAGKITVSRADEIFSEATNPDRDPLDGFPGK